MKLEKVIKLGFLSFVLLVLIVSPLKADTKIENWVQLNQTLSLTDSLSFFAEIQPRISYSEGELSSLIARLAPIYQINSHSSVGAGFLWQPTYSPSASNETRIFLQYIYNHGVSTNTAFTHRFRLEYRAIDTTMDKAYRVRYQLRTLHSWFSGPSLKFLLANELFFNLNTTVITGPMSGFDQNRLFLGFNYQWNKNISSDVAYLYNYVHRPRAIEDRNNHIFFYALHTSF